MAQQYLRRAVEDNRAKGGTIVVIDPAPATCSRWRATPRSTRTDSSTYPADRRANRAVTDAWEPGSVNKIVTAAAALETRSVSLSERFTVPAFRT